MRQQVQRHRRRPGRAPAAAARGRDRAGQGAARPGWPTTTSRSSATASTASTRSTARRCCAPCPAPASASCGPTRTWPSASGKLPPLVEEKAREKTLLVLAKANSKATVHRPVYLDYVGREDVRRRRRGRGGAALPRAVLLDGLHRVADPDPGGAGEGLRRDRGRRRGEDEPHRQGPHGHPGDLPARRALPDAARGPDPDRQGGALHPRAAAAAAVRPARRLPALPLVPGLPAAGPLQHRRCGSGSRASSSASSAATRSSTPPGSASRCSRGCTSSCVPRRARS